MMARPVSLLCCVLVTLAAVFAQDETDPGGAEVAAILGRLRASPAAVKVYREAHVIYSEFKASESRR